MNANRQPSRSTAVFVPVPRSDAIPPSVINAAAVHVSTINSIISRHRLMPMSTVNSPDQGGQGGFGSIPPLPAGYTFVEGTVVHQFIPASSMVIPTGSETKANYLYAPTTHFPSQCFEVGSYFEHDGTPPNYVKFQGIIVADFCDPEKIVVFYKNTDNNVWGPTGTGPFSNYLGNSYFSSGGYSATTYLVNISVIPGTTIEQPSLFNYTTGQYDVLRFASGNPLQEDLSQVTPSQTNGWSFYETHYFNDPTCPSEPPVSAQGMFFGASSPGMPSYYSPSNLAPYEFNFGDCFSNNNTIGAYYVPVYTTSPNSSWTITSQPSS